MSRPLAEIPKASFAAFRRAMAKKAEAAILRASDRAATDAKEEIRAGFTAAGKGRLGLAIGVSSDLKKGRGVNRGADGSRASGAIFVRSKSKRTEGAIEAYTEGADIRPRKARWLWIASPEIPARVGRQKMTPELYTKSGLEERIGPLVPIDGDRPGERLLIVLEVSVRKDKPRGSARRLPRRGSLRGAREYRDILVAFIGIKSTSRRAVVNPRVALARAVRRLPQLVNEELRQGGR